MIYRLVFLLALTLGWLSDVNSQNRTELTKIARIQYRGGGDWYNDPSALTNLIRFAKVKIPLAVDEQYDDVPVGSRDLHKYAFAFLTGHGNITLNSAEASNVRNWLDAGGFLYVDDDYGLDKHARAMLETIYPNESLVELPFDHPIYSQVYNFKNGLPKIHEHDGKSPQGFGIFREGRLVVFYTYECNLADGWTDAGVHGVPEGDRKRSLEMGTNILFYSLTTP